MGRGLLISCPRDSRRRDRSNCYIKVGAHWVKRTSWRAQGWVGENEARSWRSISPHPQATTTEGSTILSRTTSGQEQASLEGSFRYEWSTAQWERYRVSFLLIKERASRKEHRLGYLVDEIS